MKMNLNGLWRGIGLAPNGEKIEFDGHIPGCAHTDMLKAGRLKDLFYRDQANESQWIEKWNWIYERTFDCDTVFPNTTIEFEGLDTYCAVYLNGIEIGRADDMFIPHIFPAKSLRKGENTLRVVFFSPIVMTNGLPPRIGAFTVERMYTRRIQCTYFWDWVDRFVTMGIFRDVYLHSTDLCEIEDVKCETHTIDDYGAWLFYRATFTQENTDTFCRITLHDPDGNVVWTKRRRIVEDYVSEMIDVDEPRLWWPNGYGAQPLYRLETAIETDEGYVIDQKILNIGIRTIRILQKQDKTGTPEYEKSLRIKNGYHVSGSNAFWDRNREDEFSGFALIVNGVPIFCKGANWVPCEPFPSEETPEKIEKLIGMLHDMNGNMLRIWGGGIFEQDALYDTCDRLGILVTQDFLMACGSYPEKDETFLKHLMEEAAFAAKRLRNHCCLAWWTGDNENGMDGDEDMIEYNGRRAALRAIGPILARLDPNRPFLPSSPYSGRPYGSITKGTTHNTNYIGEWFSYIRFNEMRDYRIYFDQYLSRFCAEEPIMGVPATSSLQRFLTTDDIFGDDDSMMRFHTKNNPAEVFKEFQIYDYLCAIAEKLFGVAKCREDRISKMQYVQYEWCRITMELYRREKWYSSGLVYWMLNDCWPANGWAIIDYYAKPKAAWYAFKRTAKPLICCIDKVEDGQYLLHVICDGRAGAKGCARIFLQPFDRVEPIAEVKASFEISANCRQTAITAHLPAADENTLLMAEIEGDGFNDRTWFFETRPQDQHFPENFPSVIARLEDSITLKAESYVHAVILDGETVFDDNYFSMLPGETKIVHFDRCHSPIILRTLASSLDTIRC